MHHLIADDKVVKRWNVDKMILEFPNKVEKTSIVLLGAKN